MVIDGISEDIRRRREEYLELMAQHGSMSPAEIIASVRETQARLLDVFGSVTESDALRKPAPGEWCLRELAQHAVFTERLIAKIIHHGARGEIPSREDLEGAGIGMMPPDDGKTYDEILDDLRSMNDALVRSLEELPAEPNRELKMPHPFFGPLDCLEWAGFQRVHDTDHIHHAEKIIASTAE
jgi:hypothetical protein